MHAYYIEAASKIDISSSIVLHKTEHPNFVRINRSEIVNLNAIDGFEGNCYYIGKNPLYATGVYRQRMEGVFVKAKQL
ncbi:MAG: hypothetical protein J5924_00260 [Bacteroidaceae bacterium]|nr:hypothetical protein [Bacteroidaceae bacterium]